MQQLFNLFEEMGKPYFRQGSLSDEDYKPSFFTFWNIDTPNTKHRDNKVKERAQYIQVGHYTNDANEVYSKKDENGQIITLSPIDDFCKRARLRGWKIEGEPKDANADKDNYFGRVCYLRIINKSED